MQDPFRPNSNAQLMREAQMGFIVIGLLLCVLVYVAFYRLTNRSSRFDEIARSVAVAEPVDSDPYQAHSFVQNEQKLTERFARDKRDVFAASEVFSSKPSPSKFQQSSPVEKVAQATHVSSFAAPKKRNFAKPKTGSSYKHSAAATGFVPVAKHIPTVPRPSKAPSVQSDFDVAKEPSSMKLLKEQPKVAPPVLKSKFGSLPSQDFLPAPSLREVKAETDPTAFRAFPLSPSKEISTPPKVIRPKVNPPKSIPKKPVASIPDSIHRVLTRQLPAPTVVKSLPTEFMPQPVAAQKQLDSKRIDLIEADEPSRVVQTSAFEPIKPAPVPVRESSPKRRNSAAMRGKTFTTRKGDSLWTIAQAVYGDGRYFRALHELNRDTLSLSEAIPAGTVLNVSTIEELQRDYPALCPVPEKARGDQDDSGVADTNEPVEDALDERFYRTEDGDTLFEIARQRLGQASRYLEIYELNRFRIPETANHLTPLGGGIELLLPQ